MTYLVTGGSGYLGSRIVRQLLNQNHEVVVFDWAGPTTTAREVIGENNFKKLTFVPGDISDTIQLFTAVQEYEIHTIIHTATLLGRRSDAVPATALRINCGGMNNVLEAARLFKLKRVVWTGAVMAIGGVEEFYKEPIGDKAVYKPVTMYSATKALNEFMARLYFERFGVDSIGLRVPRVIGVTYGPNQWDGSAGTYAAFLKKAACNIPVTRKEPDVVSYVYVEDAADAHVTACQVPTTKRRIFNVITGTYTRRELVETIGKVNPEAQVSVEKETDPWYRDPLLDTKGLKSELGWQPGYDLERLLREVFNTYRQQEGLPLV